MAGPAVRIVAQALAAMSSVSKQFTLNVPCLISEEEKKKGRKEERSKKKKRKAILVSVNKYTTYVVCGCDQEIDAVPHPHSRKVQKYTFRWHDTSFKINAVHICVVLQKDLRFLWGESAGGSVRSRTSKQCLCDSSAHLANFVLERMQAHIPLPFLWKRASIVVDSE